MILAYLISIALFLVVVFFSNKMGRLFGMLQLPLISGFLLAGILAGPYLIGVLSTKSVGHLVFVDQVSLAVIAFIAGTELYWEDLKERFHSITYITAVQTFFVFILGSVALYLLSGMIPFMKSMSAGGRITVSLIAASILIARSPSSAIAIVSELRAKGPFTQTVLGVTMVTDVVVIVRFAISHSLAQPLLSTKGFELSFLLILGVELIASLLLGLAIAWVIRTLLWSKIHTYIQSASILIIGYAVFAANGWLLAHAHHYLPIHFHYEPLLVCMIAGFAITNFSRTHEPFHEHLHNMAFPIYVAFFTLTGASLNVNLLVQTWAIALVLVIMRLVMLFMGSWVGGRLAGDPEQHNRLSWMTYVTQAGVSLGLAKQVATAYPSWGQAFAALMISVIVINQLAGPPFFKWAIQRVGEAEVKDEELPEGELQLLKEVG
ncbi:MAG TPA: hypothetical protein DCE42_17760 [Myxococcales bacterium]|nr:hypothetical protein [Myxococcales bacterium]